MVFLVPGSRIISGRFSCPGCSTYRRVTSSRCSNARKSVKLEIRGVRITAMSIFPPLPVFLNRSVRLSSSSISTCRYGVTPSTGTRHLSSSICIPGSSMVLSPRNLLMISPFTRSFSSGSSSIRVPRSCANTPPRSISPTSRTGASSIFASPMLTISFSFRLISAGLPAPSMTIRSYSFSSFPYASRICGTSRRLQAK